MGLDSYTGDRDLERLFALRDSTWIRGSPTKTVQWADAGFLARVARHEDHYGVGRLPYWLRLFHPLLWAEYQQRMEELATAMMLLDRQARADAAQQHFDPLETSGRRGPSQFAGGTAQSLPLLP